eukprot:1906626-Pyramimonas_sp.AAC.1
MWQRDFDVAANGLLAYLGRYPPQSACPAITQCPVHFFSCGVILACPAFPACVAPARTSGSET